MNRNELISQQETAWFDKPDSLDKDTTVVVLIPVNDKIGRLIISPVERYLESMGFKLNNPDLKDFRCWTVDMVNMIFTRERWTSGTRSTPSQIKAHLEEKKTRLNAKRSGLID